MLRLEDWMDLKDLQKQGLPISQIAQRTGRDRKTVRKYLNANQPPRSAQRKKKPSKLDLFKKYLHSRMGQGVFNCVKLLDELRSRGYTGKVSILKNYVQPYRDSQRELATVRFETNPGEQAQVDWAHFGKILHEEQWRKLYGFMMTMGYSRAVYLEFTASQDTEHFLQCQMNAFRYFLGIPEEILVDNLKSAVLWREGSQIRWNPRYLDFAAHYGFVPKACWPYRAQTKGKVENTVLYVRGNFWVGIEFRDLVDLNEQARVWMDEVANVRLHQTTRSVPFQRLEEERAKLVSVEAVAAYDPSYISQRIVTKDCLISYRGVRYSVPHAYAGKVVTVREPLDDELLHIHFQDEQIAAHSQSRQKGAMVLQEQHYQGLGSARNWLRHRKRLIEEPRVALPAGPGVGRAYVAPEVEERSLAVYEQMIQGGS
jgi:transposase